MAGIESSRKEEETEKMWVEFPEPPFTACIITDDSGILGILVKVVLFLRSISWQDF